MKNEIEYSDYEEPDEMDNPANDHLIKGSYEVYYGSSNRSHYGWGIPVASNIYGLTTELANGFSDPVTPSILGSTPGVTGRLLGGDVASFYKPGLTVGLASGFSDPVASTVLGSTPGVTGRFMGDDLAPFCKLGSTVGLASGFSDPVAPSVLGSTLGITGRFIGDNLTPFYKPGSVTGLASEFSDPVAPSVLGSTLGITGRFIGDNLTSFYKPGSITGLASEFIDPVTGAILGRASELTGEFMEANYSPSYGSGSISALSDPMSFVVKTSHLYGAILDCLHDPRNSQPFNLQALAGIFKISYKTLRDIENFIGGWVKSIIKPFAKQVTSSPGFKIARLVRNESPPVSLTHQICKVPLRTILSPRTHHTYPNEDEVVTLLPKKSLLPHSRLKKTKEVKIINFHFLDFRKNEQRKKGIYYWSTSSFRSPGESKKAG